MGSDNKAEVEIDVKGADRAAAAARTAFQPFSDYAAKAQGAFKSLRGEAASALGGVVSDLGRVITVGSSISFAGAVQGVQSLEAATSQLSVAMKRDWKGVQDEVNKLAKDLGTAPEQVANYVNNVGRKTYDFSYAEKSLATFSKFAKETGRELNDTGGLASAFKTMGIEDADKALRQLRANAENLKTVGGVAALSDQVAGLAGSFAKASGGASQMIALTASIAKTAKDKGLGAAQTSEIQRGIFGSLESNAQLAEVHLRRSGLLKKDQHIIDPATGKVDFALEAQLLQKDFQRYTPEQRLRRSRAWFGNNQQLAATFFAGDYSNKTLGELAAQGADTDAAARLGATPGGKRGLWDAVRDVNLQKIVGADTTLGQISDKFRAFSAENPIAGKAGEYGTAAGAGFFARSLVPRLFGLGGSSAGSGAAAAAEGGGGFAGTVGSTLAAGGAGAGAIAGGAALAWAAPFLTLLGVGSAAKQGFSSPELTAEGADARRGAAAAAIAEAARHRSAGVHGAMVSERARIAAERGLGVGGDGLSKALGAFMEARKLGASKEEAEAIAKAVRDAVQGVALNITVVNATGGPISVEPQPGGFQ